MSTERWERVKQILEEVLRIPSEQRQAYLDVTCGPDRELRSEIESLVDSHEAAGSQFLAAPAPEVLLTCSADSDKPPRHRTIGPYRLVEELGRGGMGQVWLAEQTAPVKRQLALKLIKGGMFDCDALQRFQSERQSLAIMDHPSIAKVFDAGATPDGQPYFVMEYVPGVPITEYCDQERLTIRDRLELFIAVCEGVQHAHQKAIIHRDLKPANILVVEVDGKPAPRIIDFGLAKGANAEVLGEARLTMQGSFLGTPGYMSPEQADPSVHDVDTRTDVYSLGAILYVMLSGCLPFDTEEWGKQPFDQALRQLREEDPPRPSTKAGLRRDATKTTAEARRTEPKELIRLLRGDLDWITMKALERDRARRYATPGELAADCRRYLQNQPVHAHPPGFWYSGGKFLRRYRIPVAAGALMISSLMTGLYVANRERVLAERRFRDVRELANKLFEIDVQARELPGSTKTRQLIVDTSLEYLSRLGADVRGDPELELELGNAYMRVARVQGVPISPTLGQMAEAEKNLRTADTFIQSVLRSQPRNRTAMLRAAQIAHDRMILARFQHNYDEALDLAKDSAKWLEKFQAGKGDEAESSAILNTYLNVAGQFKSEGEVEEALRLCNRGSEIAGILNRPAHRGNFLRVSAQIFQERGDLDQALKAIQESVKLLDPGPDWLTKGGQTANFQLSLVSEGEILGEDNSVSLGRSQEAVRTLERAYQMADELVHRDPNDHSSRGSLATAGIAMADILRHSDPHRALDIYDHTLRHLAETPDDAHLQRFEVQLLAGSSYPLRQLGRSNEAQQRVQLALERLKKLGFDSTDKIELGSEMEETLRALADNEAARGDVLHAIEIYDKLLKQIEATESDANLDMEDSVRLSTICDAAAALYRRVGRADLASALQARRNQLWRTWDNKLHDNLFVQRQITAKTP